MMKLNIKKNVDLKDKTTFKVGGRAEFYVEVFTEDELIEAVDFAKEKSLPIFYIGGGSNILIDDDGLKGLVIKYMDQNTEFIDEGEHYKVKAGAGLEWDKLVEESVSRNLQGIECLSGIPGLVGAAPMQNIGAYGQELKDVFVQLTAYDRVQEKQLIFKKEECDFGYRTSIFKRPENKGRYLILNITLKLNKNGTPSLKYKSLTDFLNEKGIENPTLQQTREAVLELRGSKLEDPGVIGNAGSFFKNPIVDQSKLDTIKEKYPDLPSYETDDGKYKLFAGWLIDKAGWRGKTIGNARVSDKNALVLTNPGSATASDLKQLAYSIQQDIKEKFDVELEPEVNIL